MDVFGSFAFWQPIWIPFAQDGEKLCFDGCERSEGFGEEEDGVLAVLEPEGEGSGVDIVCSLFIIRRLRLRIIYAANHLAQMTCRLKLPLKWLY